jgi:hypothetical protein
LKLEDAGASRFRLRFDLASIWASIERRIALALSLLRLRRAFKESNFSVSVPSRRFLQLSLVFPWHDSNYTVVAIRRAARPASAPT